MRDLLRRDFRTRVIELHRSGYRHDLFYAVLHFQLYGRDHAAGCDHVDDPFCYARHNGAVCDHWTKGPPHAAAWHPAV